MTTSFDLLLTATLTMAPPSPASASPKGSVCYRATGPIHIDGRRDEPAWQAVLPALPVVSPPEIQVRDEGYEASVECRLGDRGTKRLHVRSDSRLWEE